MTDTPNTRLVELTEAQIDLVYGMLTQRLYLRETDPDRADVINARTALYSFTSHFRETTEAKAIVTEEAGVVDLEQPTPRETKIVALTPLNVRAIQETIPRDLGVTTTPTTATFEMDADSALALVKGTIARLGGGNSHPRGSLQAVARKLYKETIVQANEKARTEVAS